MTAQELYDYYIAHGADRDLITATTAKSELIDIAQNFDVHGLDVSGIAAQDFARCFNADFAADLIDGVPEEIRSTLLDGFLPEFVYYELYDITDIAADWSGRFTDIVIADGNVMEFKFRDSCDEIRYFGRRHPGDIFRIGNPAPVVWWPPYLDAEL